MGSVVVVKMASTNWCWEQSHMTKTHHTRNYLTSLFTCVWVCETLSGERCHCRLFAVIILKLFKVEFQGGFVLIAHVND